MADDTLSAQDVIYAASALRGEASRAEATAHDPAYQSSARAFEHAAETYRALATKFDRIANRLTGAERGVIPPLLRDGGPTRRP